MKRKTALELYSALNEVGKLKGVNFGYAVAKNKNKLQGEVESIQAAEKSKNETLKAHEKYTVYDKKRIELCETHAVKDQEGKPLMVKNRYIMENETAFAEALIKLREKHPEAIKLEEAENKSLEELLNGDIEIKLETIKKDDIPQDANGDQIGSIIAMIEG